MKKHLFFTVIILGLFVSYLALINQPREERANFRNKVTGTYLLIQSDGFRQILTIAAHGTAFSQNSG